MNIDLSFLQSLLAFLLILTPIVFIHELGHFLLARLFGVRVEIFSVGFGPTLFSFNDQKGTKWQVASIKKKRRYQTKSSKMNWGISLPFPHSRKDFLQFTKALKYPNRRSNLD